MVNQVSSVWFDNELLRKSLQNETNCSKCEFTEKFYEFFNLIFNSVQDGWLKSAKFCCICMIVEFFPLGLNALENARENEIRLQLYQSYK